ncbi:PREDICTED: uncharacterized protein LOC106790935 [Polistes canadensis]|uniref:uncharacterized protein LOC106790935 n=1 Tax=Polistes canadensis TaxID=91411 RepID=UPI000718B9A2|nr:PREDICTED: uncharacterized protein LOC106790935 [Polistes canadensis]
MYLFFSVVAILYLSTFNIGDAQYQAPFDCNTPNGVAGSCINIRQCIPLIKLLQERPLPPESENYLRQSQCGFEGQNPRVCCPAGSNRIDLSPSRGNIPSTDSPLETGNKAELIDNLLNNPLLPSECGKDLIVRIIGGTPTALEEFPWMALLEYQHPRGHSTACGGVLISKRYVLTAAHCLKGKDLPPTWSLKNVRLGEYDTSSDKDCITSNDVVICSDDPITVGIEEQIVHEQYDPRSRDQKYDIAMLRLSRDIISTDYIKPICLPRSEGLDGQLYVAGWGTTEFNSSSNIKLKVSLPLAEKEDCARTYNQVNIRLGYGQICAGGTKGKDSCRGDSGGPLVSRLNTLSGAELWTTVGVVSFGPTPCGLQGWPGVYTKVYDYVPWIVGNIKPYIQNEDYIRYLHHCKCQLVLGFPTVTKSVVHRRHSMYDETIIAQNLISRDCNTPNGTSGSCISIQQCLPFVAMLQEKPIRSEIIDYLKQSNCGFEGHDPHVCCPTESDLINPFFIPVSFPPTTVKNSTLENMNNNDPIISLLDNPLLPSECGRDSKPRDLEVRDTALDEFPWMALLEYDDGSKTTFACQGVLITKRYVLTAAHCLLNQRIGILSNVRLGEYDLSFAKDCVKRNNLVTCSDDPITVKIEKQIPHELYVPRSDNNEYDIGLLRLSRDIVSTNYVKPICLPKSSIVNKRLYIAGWDTTSTNTSSNVKLKVSLPLVDKDDCDRIYKNQHFKQICAGGETDRALCSGDAGGPLMGFQDSFNGNRIWTAEGIVSYGTVPCGIPGWPGIYTKVYDFIPWIISKIRL